MSTCLYPAFLENSLERWGHGGHTSQSPSEISSGNHQQPIWGPHPVRVCPWGNIPKCCKFLENAISVFCLFLLLPKSSQIPTFQYLGKHQSCTLSSRLCFLAPTSDFSQPPVKLKPTSGYPGISNFFLQAHSINRNLQEYLWIKKSIHEFMFFWQDPVN